MGEPSMKVFWFDVVSGRGVESSEPVDADLSEVKRIWFDEIRGVEGNFLGLIDDLDRTVQFRFEEDVPDHVDDAHDLRIVSVDFPCPPKKGSFAAMIIVGDVGQWIEDVFKNGANPSSFKGLSFEPW